MKQFLELLLNLEPGQLAGADDWGPRFLGAPQSSWAILGILLAAAALVWLTVRSYLREGDVPRRAKLTLAGVRIAVILLVLATLLQPAITIKKIRMDYSTVVVLMDDSLSMSLKDHYVGSPVAGDLARQLGASEADLAEMRRCDIARSLMTRQGGAMAKLAKDHPLLVMRFSTDSPDGDTTQTLGLIEMSDDGKMAASGPPSLAGIVVAIVLAGVSALWLAVLLAWLTFRSKDQGARSKDQGNAGKAREKASPWAFLHGWAALIGGALAVLVLCVGATYAHNAIRARAMAAGKAVSPVARVVNASVELQSAVRGLAGRGFQTDLVQAVREAASQVTGRRTEAMVVITDGQDTSAASGEARLVAAREFARQQNIALITVGVGDETPARNVRVASLAIPAQVRLNSSVDAQITVQTRNLLGQPLTVRLLRQSPGQSDWQDTGLTAEVVPGATSQPTSEPASEPADAPSETTSPADKSSVQNIVRIPLQFGELGQFVYKAVVEPREGEFLATDNEAQARVAVSDEKTRVLLISGDSGWEFQYLRNYLLRNPQKYLVSTWQQNADGDFNQEASTGMKLTALPRKREELIDKYDVVILYDPAFTTGGFDQEMAKLLNEFVGTHRGGLCYIASGKYTSDNLSGAGPLGQGGQARPFDALAGMLPVVLGRETLLVAERIGRDEKVGWPVTPTGVGADSPIMQLDSDAKRNQSIWSVLPGIFWAHPVARLTPAAVALAVSSDPSQRTEDGEPLPLVASAIYGRGPVVYVGFDSTWRWRYVSNAAHYERFWGNVVDFLASYRLMKKHVLITSSGDQFPVGATMTISAEVYDEKFDPATADKYVVRMVNPRTGSAQPIELTHESRPGGKGEILRSGLFRGSVKLTDTGEFELTGPEGLAVDTVAGKTITVTLPQEEFLHPEANPAALKILAGQSGYVPAERFDSLAERIPAGRLPIVEEVTRDLWNVWLVMVVLFVLVTVEWIGRKKCNMI